MEEEVPKCYDCILKLQGNPMDEIGGIGKIEQIGEYIKQNNSSISRWQQTGVREKKLYQCSECKSIKIF